MRWERWGNGIQDGMTGCMAEWVEREWCEKKKG